ncbi:MAG: hypothetical protein LBF42_03805 [Puniceicoccales bacterium]|jgi:type III secretion protein C|nr:hypothetical protein [Puniceicoccales bacterium]
MKNFLKAVSLVIVLLCSIRLFGETIEKAHSMTIPFSESYYYHFSKDQKLSDLIQDFCSMQNISVVISPNITDIVNGRFNKMSPSDFWDHVTRAYGLTWFYDGKILYVYKGSELKTKIFKMDGAGIVVLSDIIGHLGFSSSDFSFRSIPDAHILIVTAPPKYLETIEDLSEKFVSEKISDTTIVKSFPLKYAWAYDMSFTYNDGSLTVPGVATLLQSIVSGKSGSSVSGMSVDMDKGGARKVQGVDALVVETRNDSPSRPMEVKSEKGSSENGTKNISSSSSLPGFITCDQRLNSVIIRDRYENMTFYEDIIKQLDVPCEVIKIDVAIMDISRNNGLDFALSALGLIDTRHNNILNIKSSNSNVSSGETISGDGNAFTKLTGILKKYDISSYVSALESIGNSQAIAKPSILTLDNVGAVVEKSTTLYSKTTGNRANMYSITAATKLRVVPHIIPGDINKDGKHKMKMFVNIEDGGIIPPQDGNGDASNSTNNNSSINTQAVLYEGQSLLIGGYFHETHSKKESGIPIIMDLPFIGFLFRSTKSETELKERIYLISPTIVDINSSTSEFDQYMNVIPLAGKALISPTKFAPPHKSKSSQSKPPKSEFRKSESSPKATIRRRPLRIKRRPLRAVKYKSTRENMNHKIINHQNKAASEVKQNAFVDSSSFGGRRFASQKGADTFKSPHLDKVQQFKGSKAPEDGEVRE